MSDPYPLYTTSYTLHRLSPLHTPAPLLLPPLAKRLQDTLANTLRGVQLETPENTSAAGALRQIAWEWLGDEARWAREHPPDSDDEEQEETLPPLPPLDPADAKGMLLRLHYERATYIAVFLRSARGPAVKGFTPFPLLATRMPAGTRTALLAFISETFDARVGACALSSSFMAQRLETLVAGYEGEGWDVQKGLAVQIAFPSAGGLVRGVNVTLQSGDLAGFVERGREGEEMREGRGVVGPFTRGLDAYLRTHMAFSLAGSGTQFARFAFGPVALGAEGRVNVLTASGLGRGVWDALVLEAETQFDGAAEEGVKSEFEVVERARGRTMESLPSEPPPPYELHDPARSGR
ncbi:hypothetical protein EJ06DRAFT_373110 [Trichodelitschia bisporula]|uniref:Uncharacterized protein n=1 Tax=Trichodelitschia bisporula TaxID=703511 RepID=A0A6G1I1X3_9PEZI|nr:hypothetical protein EJ06DRAFT_373110 [Trichodelitschia bisporula]